MTKILVSAVLCLSLLFPSFPAYTGQGHGHGHRGHHNGPLIALGIFAGTALIASYLSRPRYPAYPPAPVYYVPNYHYGYYYRPVYVRPPPVVYAPRPVQYVPPTVTYVQPPVVVPPSSCLMVREYQTEIEVGDKIIEGYGYACLQPDGSWRRGAPIPVR